MFLGLDLGTTNIKAVVANSDGEVVSRASTAVDLLHTSDGGIEQDIEQIYASVIEAMQITAHQCDASSIQAIGVSSQGGALQLLDSENHPFGRVISWMDTRGRRYDETLDKKLGVAWFADRIGHLGSGLTLGQCRRLEPQLRGEMQVGWVGDVIVSRLCGRRGHDATSLSLALLYNPRLGKADPDVLELLGLREEQLPDLLSSRDAAGTLKAEVAQTTGLPPGIPVSPAVHDQYASALGAGAVAPGDVMLGTGTAWVLLVTTRDLPQPVTTNSFACTHIVPSLYGQIVSLGNGGSSFRWVADMVGQADCETAELDAMLSRIPPGCEGLLCWPFLTGPGDGLRPDVFGRFTGLRLSHTKGHLLRAVLEGLAFELARYLQYANVHSSGARLVMCGKAAESKVTPQILADVTGLDVACTNQPDTSDLGAAILARGLVQKQTPLENLAKQTVSETNLFRPGPDRSSYRNLLAAYLSSLPQKE